MSTSEPTAKTTPVCTTCGGQKTHAPDGRLVCLVCSGATPAPSAGPSGGSAAVEPGTVRLEATLHIPPEPPLQVTLLQDTLRDLRRLELDEGRASMRIVLGVLGKRVETALDLIKQNKK